MQVKKYNSASEGVREVFRNEGLLGFYRGFFITIMREVPFACIQFPLFEYLKSRLRVYTGKSELGYLQAGFSGAIAGGTAALITTPLDVLKTRIMLSTTTRKRPIPLLISMIQNEGPGALMKGAIPRTIWISAGGFIFLGTYEFCVSFLQKRHM